LRSGRDNLAERQPGWKPDESGELLVKDEGVDLIMDRMPDIKELVEEDEKQIPWYESKNVH
jgi:hypothetical protein